MLPQLWELDLHDNVIRNDGLIDLATSRTAQRLLELDLEQDCWNSRTSRYIYHPPMPAELLDRAAFPSLDSIRLGVVDEYHGARYTGGIPVYLLEDLRSTPAAWPVLIGFLAHLSHGELWDGYGSEPTPEPEESNFMAEPWASEQHEHDFRFQRVSRHAEFVAQARDAARHMIDGDTQHAPMPAAPAPVAAEQVTDNEPPF